jgi:hypothetical protein
MVSLMPMMQNAGQLTRLLSKIVSRRKWSRFLDLRPILAGHFGVRIDGIKGKLRTSAYAWQNSCAPRLRRARYAGGDQPSRPIRLRVDQYLTIEGQNKNDEEWTSVPVQTVNVTGKPVSIALNRAHLLKALRFGLHALEIEDALSPVAFSDSNSTKTMIIMPLNLGEGKMTVQAPAQSSSEASPPPAQPTTPQEQPAPTTEEQ